MKSTSYNIKFLINKSHSPVVALGSDGDGGFSIIRGECLKLYYNFGDLSEYKNYRNFLECLTDSIKDLEPFYIATDLHPDYISTRLASKLPNLGIIKVQHHYAHIITVMSINHFAEPVIGIAFDGTGYGIDGTVWGGEILVVSFDSFTRIAHIKQYQMPGGDMAIIYPWRMLLSYLYTDMGYEKTLNFFNKNLPPKKEADILIKLLSRSSFPVTSSAGRLFDGVSAALGLVNGPCKKAEAAIKLEQSCIPTSNYYSYKITLKQQLNKENFCFILDPAPMWEELIDDINNGENIGICAMKFHNMLIYSLTELVCRIREYKKISTVVLSGGVFYNKILTDHLVKKLTADDFKVLISDITGPGDSNISLGQAIIALNLTG